MSTKKITKRLLQTSILAGAFAAVAMPAPAVAQGGGAENDDEIVITGSRIARKDFTSSAPVATVDGAQIDITGTVNTESLLNTLPQTVPGLDRTSNNPGNGTATVDLRGLGTNRTLVLIDGLRAVPTSQGGTVDINNIPVDLIENIEVLTGGASSVYGSDAVAGVVNFILKDDFEGVKLNAGYEQTQDSDAKIYNTSLTIGANSSDGRGNVVLNMTYNDRDELFQGDRDFSFFAQFDGANGLINGGSSGIPSTSIFSNANAGPGTLINCDRGRITFNTDSSLRCFESDDPVNNDFYNYAPVNYIQLPQERFQATSLGSYELSDTIEAYARASYTYSRVPQQLAPTPIFQTVQFTIDDSPFLPAGTEVLLSDGFGDGVDTDGDGIDDTGTAFVRRRLLEVGPRISDDLFNSFQFVAGLRGDFNENWSWDLNISEGTVTGTSTQLGNVNRDRFQQALLVDTSDQTGQTCTDSSANGATINCAPINIFGEGNISSAGAAFLNTAVAAAAEYNQFFLQGNITGELPDSFDLPGGPIGVAFGVEYRDEDADFRPSQDLAAGTIAGFNGSPAQGGAFDVSEFYGEVLLPIASGREFAELLELEASFRYSDYSTVGGVESYKIAGRWAPTDQLTFRGSFNTAVRAPSIAELFGPASEGFPGAEDPCSSQGPNVGNATVAAICQATGVPAGQVFSPDLDSAAGQVRALFGGNENLDAEDAETFTLGAVFEPSAVPGLVFSVDYFDIEIQDVITTIGTANTLNSCYDPATGDASSVFCSLINRRADGTINFVTQTLQNSASQTLKGVDFVGEWQFDAWGGDATINYVGTYTEESEFIAFEGDTPIECAGNFGLLCGEPLPEYKHRASFGWSKDRFSGQVLWRHIGSVDDDDPDTDYFVESLDAENYFDVSASYELSDSFKATFGVDNLFDTDPPIIGDNQEQANTYPATYDVFGRTFFVRGTITK